MALKALDIFKLLPKTNCKKCGCPTCLAFAMKLAQKQAKLEDCPDVTSAARTALEGSAAPPIRLVTIGAGEGKIEIGNETVMFRHDETFYHAPGIGVIVPDTLTDGERQARLAAIRKLAFMRVGAVIKVNVVAVENASGAVVPFVKTAAAAAELARDGTPCPASSPRPTPGSARSTVAMRTVFMDKEHIGNRVPPP